MEKPGRTAEIGSKRVSGVAAQPTRKRLIFGTLSQCTPKGLANSGKVGEALGRQTDSFLDRTGLCRPAFSRRVFAYGFWVTDLAQIGLCAQRVPRAPRACTRIMRRATG